MNSFSSIGGKKDKNNSKKIADITKKIQRCVKDIEAKKREIASIKSKAITLKKQRQSLKNGKRGGFTNQDPVEKKNCLVLSIVGCRYKDTFLIFEILKEENTNNKFLRFYVERVNGDNVIDITLLMNEIPRKLQKLFLFCKKHSAVIDDKLIGTDISKNTDKTYTIQELESDFFDLSNEVTIVMENVTPVMNDTFLNIQDEPTSFMETLRALKTILNNVTADMVKDKAVNKKFLR